MADNQSQPAPQQEESIFSEEDLLNSDQYDKHVRQARNTIFVIAGIQFISGIVIAATGDQSLIWYNFGFSTFVALIFLAIGFWAKSKPYYAIITALVLFGLIQVVNFIAEPMSILRGVLFKIFILIYLVKGLRDAREAQYLKEELGK